MKKIICIFLLLFFSVNTYAVEFGMFYNDGYAGLSATKKSIFLGVGYKRIFNKSENPYLNTIEKESFSFILLFKKKPTEELKFNYLGGVGFSMHETKLFSSYNFSNAYYIYLGLETKINNVGLKFLYIPFKYEHLYINQTYPEYEYTLNEGLRILVNVPF